jgi:hypothetical protein
VNLAVFLQSLFQEGRILVDNAPVVSAANDRAAVSMLERAFRTVSLNLAGPPLPMDRALALAAGRLVYDSAWLLFNHDEPESTLAERLVLPYTPTAPEHHLSADIVLRYVPTLYRRARASNPADALPRLLARLLRAWPLSGVFADLEEEPLTAIDFGGHPGLLFLYAERLARHQKTAWFPKGMAGEYVELVWRELGKDPALLPQES